MADMPRAAAAGADSLRARSAGGLGGRPEPPNFIGRPMKRREDKPLIVGGGRYVDDIKPAGLCHLVFVRSPHAHARLVSARLDAARRAPGVVAVATRAD